MKQILYILLFTYYISNTTFPQNPEWIVYNTANSNIPSNKISCVAIDDTGNKWIGTNKGLAKFDGTDWTIYNTSNSDLPTNYINCSATDKENNLWLGTNEGLVKFDVDYEIFTGYNVNNSAIPHNKVTCLAIDKLNIKWLSTQKFDDGLHSGGLVKFDDTAWIVYDTLNSGLPSNNVFCITIDEVNNKWIGTCIASWGMVYGKGLAKYDDNTWTIYNVTNSGLPSNNVVDIAIDENGCKWILSGVETGLAKFDDENWTFFAETIEQHDNYWCLTIDLDDNKWIGMNANTGPTDYGILKYDGTGWTASGVENSELPSEHIRCIVVDRFNNKWIGTSDWEYEGGLAVFNEDGVVSVENNEVNTPPMNFEISQNYPNPFNPSTTIKYSIPKQSDVTLKVFDVLGREVAELVNKEQPQGNYKVEFDASNLTSGIYFYRIQAGNFIKSKKMIFMK